MIEQKMWMLGAQYGVNQRAIRVADKVYMIDEVTGSETVTDNPMYKDMIDMSKTYTRAWISSLGY